MSTLSGEHSIFRLAAERRNHNLIHDDPTTATDSFVCATLQLQFGRRLFDLQPPNLYRLTAEDLLSVGNSIISTRYDYSKSLRVG